MKQGILLGAFLVFAFAGCGVPKGSLQGKAPFSSQAGTSTSNAVANAVDVRNYGAKCDGTSDDTNAIIAALKTGEPALIPAGTCGISSSVFYGGGRIVGQSITASVLQWIGQSPTMPVAATSSNVTGNIATINTGTPHNLWPHETVVVEGNSNPVFNGTFIVTSVPTPTSFTYSLVTGNTTGTGGTIGMYYMLDGSKLPGGADPPSVNYNAGWISNLTIDCRAISGVSGLLQWGDGGEAVNLHIRNCVDGYTAAQTYMNPMSHVVINNSRSQGAFIKNFGADNGAATGGSVWANGFGTYGIHIRGTQGMFDLLYAQNGMPSAIYPFYFEGDAPGITRTTTLECSSCVADSAGGINSFYIRRYYIQLDSPRVVTSGPSQDVFVFDDAWGLINNADVFPPVAPGFYTFKSLGNTPGLTGNIVLVGGGGTIEPTHATDFTTYGFATPAGSSSSALLPPGSASDPSMSFSNQPGLGWYQGNNGMVALASGGVSVFSASLGGVTTPTRYNFCQDPVVGPCWGALGHLGGNELGVIDKYGNWGGANFTANILKLGAASNDTGISRLSPGKFAFGNGTQGDASGTVYSQQFVVSGSSAPAGAAVCYKADHSLGYCATPFTGTPPTCTCQ